MKEQDLQYSDMPHALCDALTHATASPAQSIPAAWELDPMTWAGVQHDGTLFVPWTWEGLDRGLVVWKRDATSDLCEAIRRAATRADQVWVEEADYSEAQAAS